MNHILLYKKLEEERERQCKDCSHDESYCHIKNKISDVIPYYLNDLNKHSKYRSLVEGKCKIYERNTTKS